MPHKNKPTQRTNALKGSVLVKNIAEYIENKLQRHTTTFVVNDTGKYYLVNGEEVTPDDFNKMYPLALQNQSRENVDGRNSWKG